MNKRIIFKDNTTLIDFSTELNNYRVGNKTFNYTSSQDALYIGSRLPFNHFYIKMSSLNLVANTMTLQYWGGSSWNDVAELIDETSGLTSSGFVSFNPNKNDAWQMEDTEELSDLSSLKIYDQYWVKITFNQTLTVTTAISWIGNIFSDDYDLEAEFPDLCRANVKTAFKADKTSWQEQHVKASEVLVKDLQDKQIIFQGEQILIKEDFKNASVMKVAEIIFASMGDDFDDQRIRAREEYNARLSRKIARVDLNQNALEDKYEQTNETGFLRR